MTSRLLIWTVLLLTAIGVRADVVFSVYSSDVERGEMTITAVGRPEAGWHVASKAFALDGAKKAEFIGDLEQVDSCTFKQRVRVKDAADYRVQGYFRYTACSDQMCLAPKMIEFAFPLQDAQTEDGAPFEPGTQQQAKGNEQLEPGKQPPASEPIDEAFSVADTPTGGLLELFLLGVFGGLLALLTPCVWPVIPMTVSYFLKDATPLRRTDEGFASQSGGKTVRGRNMALLYGASIVVIFLTLGVAMTALMGANAMNQLATNAVFNLVCFAVFVLFGLSLLGVFTLQLPQSWAGVLDERAERMGGVIGVFFMALTLVVVSFSCTAPIVGAMLVSVVTDGDVLAPVACMLGFALALALPFTLFALFPQWMKRMPRSGEWMVRVKVVLGVVELAFSLKFLSVADQAYGWGVLPRWAFFAAWALLFGGLGVFLAYTAVRSWKKTSAVRTLAAKPLEPTSGKTPTAKPQITASALRTSAVGWAAAALVPLAFSLYLATGIFGAPCTMVAAFAPPQTMEMGTAKTDRDFTSFDEIVAAARRSGKPLFVDFTGYGCVNCRKMEAAVFTDPRVQRMLKEKYYYVALHVDDRTPLPRTETVMVRGTERKLRTVGDRWAAVEEERFGSVSQPMYVIVDARGRQVSSPRYYDEDVNAFVAWLAAGLRR